MGLFERVYFRCFSVNVGSGLEFGQYTVFPLLKQFSRGGVVNIPCLVAAVVLGYALATEFVIGIILNI